MRRATLIEGIRWVFPCPSIQTNFLTKWGTMASEAAEAQIRYLRWCPRSMQHLHEISLADWWLHEQPDLQPTSPCNSEARRWDTKINTTAMANLIWAHYLQSFRVGKTKQDRDWSLSCAWCFLLSDDKGKQFQLNTILKLSEVKLISALGRICKMVRKVFLHWSSALPFWQMTRCYYYLGNSKLKLSKLLKQISMIKKPLVNPIS